MSITTVHIVGGHEGQIINELYDQVLKNDDLFHFFFEPGGQIVIRITSQQCLVDARRLLHERGIQFLEYSYPETQDGQFGEAPFVAKYLDLYLTVFHANAVAALIMNEEDHWQYLERIAHTAFNARGHSHEQEGWGLLQLGGERLKLVGKLSALSAS